MKKIFIRGLFAIAPLAITLAVLIWLFTFLEQTFSTPLKELVGDKYYFPGLGVLTALLLIFLLGIVINTWLAQKLTNLTEKVIKRIPLVKSFYSAIEDVLGLFSTKDQKKGFSVVKVTINGMSLLGLITRKDFSELPNNLSNEGDVAVYLPMSYQVGGYTVILPRSKVTPIDMTVEKAMKFILIAGAQK